MELHNTLTRKTEAVTPLDGHILRIYSCGPTVYDHAHIGNMRAYIFADTLRRAAWIAGLNPKHVLNYTDIDDKTIRRSQERYPNMDPPEALRSLTDQYIAQFLDDMRAVGNDVDAVNFIRATESIQGMQDLITKLYEKNFAYIADDGVYFSIDAYKKAGKTYGQLLELTSANTSESRIQNDEYDKESVHDFALWKIQKDNEPAWQFQLDGHDLSGRPGWHIECSVMSRTGLGQPFDIHTGGVDLIFPHHENEIAQSTALEDSPVMARIFAHNDHILVNGKKMAKSANNFYTLKDLTDRGFDPLAFRLMILQAHYRSQVNFTWESVKAAQNRLQTYKAFADLLWELPEDSQPEGSLLQDARKDIQAALANDLDTPTALARLSALENQWLSVLTEGKHAFREFLEFIDTALGLGLSHTTDISDTQYGLIAQRDKARAAKDWAKSDELRDTLKTQGIGLRDTAEGAIWYRL